MGMTSAAQSPQPCTEKRRLAGEYRTYTDQYNRSVKALHQRTGVLQKAAYRELFRSTEQARALSEKARRDLERHIAEHGC
jgi:hypothetical protein